MRALPSVSQDLRIRLSSGKAHLSRQSADVLKGSAHHTTSTSLQRERRVFPILLLRLRSSQPVFRTHKRMAPISSHPTASVPRPLLHTCCAGSFADILQRWTVESQCANGAESSAVVPERSKASRKLDLQRSKPMGRTPDVVRGFFAELVRGKRIIADIHPFWY